MNNIHLSILGSVQFLDLLKELEIANISISNNQNDNSIKKILQFFMQIFFLSLKKRIISSPVSLTYS